MTRSRGTDNSGFNAFKDGYNRKKGGAQYLHLGAAQSLAYVRARDTLPGIDLGRTKRQQAVIDYVIYELKHEGVFGDIAKLNSLLGTADQYLITDAGFNLLDFATDMRALNGQDLSFQTLPYTPENNVPVPGYPGPQDVNIIDVPAIQQLVASAFDPQPAAQAAEDGAGKSTASPAAPAAASDVTVDVYNGDPAAVGLAAQVSQALVGLGYKAGKVENSSAQTQTVQPGTQIFYGAGAAANAQQIAVQFGATATALSTLPADHVEVLIGSTVTAVPAGIAPTSTATAGTQSTGAQVIGARDRRRARPRRPRRPRPRGRAAAARAARSPSRRTRPTAFPACTRSDLVVTLIGVTETLGKIRVIVAKAGLDGHDRGAKVVARALRDAGVEVIYTGLHQTPEQIVAAAIQEDVDAVGLSVLSGAHMTLFPRVIELLKEQDAGDIVVFGGGIIPEADIAELTAQGVAKIFTPGASTTDIVAWVNEVLAPRHAPRGLGIVLAAWPRQSRASPGLLGPVATGLAANAERRPTNPICRAAWLAARSLQALDDLADEGGGFARGLADADAGLLQGFLLGLGGAGGAGDDGAGVAHGLALGGGEPGDVADDGLGDVLLDERGGALLGVAADLADHDDGGGLRVVLEGGEAVDVRGADDRVAADADGGGEPDVAQLVHHLVGQRA